MLRNRARLIGLAIMTVLLFSIMAVPVMADAPVDKGGSDHISLHTHHVHTGDGECIEIDAVRFEPAERGLHKGANSSGAERGPFHGTCH